jgi:hypothetical protein
MSVLHVTEVGKVINLVTGFDLSGADGSPPLQVVGIRPDGTTAFTSTNVTAPAVSDPTTTPPLVANEYFQYTTQASDIDVEGKWQFYGIYQDTTPKLYISNRAFIDVQP